jgi:excisionase family DNA binding protein
MTVNESDSQDEDRCLSLREASRLLGVCVRTVRREIERGRLIAFRVGRSLRIKMSELRRYMEREAVGV